jgi:hypothetical protein
MNRLRQKLVHGKKTATKGEKKKWNVVEQPFLHYNMLTQSLTDGGGNRLVVTQPANGGKALCFGTYRGSERKDVFSEICDQVQEIMEQYEEKDSDNDHEYQQPIKNQDDLINVPVQDTILPLEKERASHDDAVMAKQNPDKPEKEVQFVLCDDVEELASDSDDDSEISDSESNTSNEFNECEQMAKQITNNSFGQNEVTSPCMDLEVVNDSDGDTDSDSVLSNEFRECEKMAQQENMGHAISLQVANNSFGQNEVIIPRMGSEAVNDSDDDISDSDSVLSNEFGECEKMAQQENMGEVHKLHAISLSSYQHGSDLFVININGDITYHTRISMLGKKK